VGAVQTILYLNTNPAERIQKMSLAGILRHAASSGHNVVVVPWAKSGMVDVRSLLAANKPVAGCIVECSDDRTDFPPRVFGSTPVVYLHAMSSLYRGKGMRVISDNVAIATAAFHELSAGNPDAFAVVAFAGRSEWSLARERAFADLAGKSGKPYFRLLWKKEAKEQRAALMAEWLSSLPRHTAIFAVNDETAAEVAAAARVAHRPIPRELTLLGVDNLTAICEESSPSISSIQLDHERAGYVAARMIADSGGFAVPSGISSIGPIFTVRRDSTGGSGRREQFILDAVEAIRREACEGLSVTALAARFRCSRRLFDLRFREATGHSVLDEILHTRFERVLALLSRPDFPIGAIADICGFGCQYELRKLFRKRYGCSMTRWRNDNAR
jgi:LacI family transcriptional regulator